MASGKFFFIVFICLFAGIACKAEKPAERHKPAPRVIAKAKPPALTPEQRKELKLPPEVIEKIEAAAGATAEPFFMTVVMQSQNLKGTDEFESRKLAGFSVRTTKADELIGSFRASLRAKGHLIFKSQKGYGTLPDILTVIKGNNSYDLLRMLGTESVHYQLDTKAIIAWLKERQREGTFVITGAGPDWVEARFIKPPESMHSFAEKIAAFAPDVLVRDTRTVEKLAEQIEETNTFYLTWD